MRKKIFFLSVFLIIFLFTGQAFVWAQENPRSNPFLRNKRVATPPGLLRLRERSATPQAAAILRNHVYTGTVSGILSASRVFTLTTRQGPKTVQTSEETKFLKDRLRSGLAATFEDLKLGNRTVAVGRVNDEALMTAKTVIISPAKTPQVKRRAVYGVVEQKAATDSGTLLTVVHPRTQKTSQVVVNTQTKITGRGLANATVNDIQIGNRIAAAGTVDEAGKITAKHLHIIPGLARGLFGTQPSTPSSRGGAR